MGQPAQQLSTRTELPQPACRATIKVNELSAWVDARLAGRDREAMLWHRVGKVGEEHGEAVAALISLTDANPRRNRGGGATVDQLGYELLDVALAAVAAHAHLPHNCGDPLQALLEHIDHVHRRAGLGSDDDLCGNVEHVPDPLGLLERAECPECGHHVERHYNREGVGCCFGWGDDMVVGCACLWAGEDLDQARASMRVAHPSGFRQTCEDPDAIEADSVRSGQ